MKKQLLAVTCLVGFSAFAQADPLAECIKDARTPVCQAYLDGMVDGALMYKPTAAGARLETNGYESRALKYRGGKRYQEANRMFCADRLPDRDALVLGVTEAFSSGEIRDRAALEQAVKDLLHCQRLN